MDKNTEQDTSPSSSHIESSPPVPAETVQKDDENTCFDPLPSLIFNYDASSKELSVNTFASGETSSVNSYQLKQSIHCKGYENWCLDDSALSDLAEKLSQGEAYQGVIGRCEDASVKIDITSDKQIVWATLIPAQGGDTLSAEAVTASIEALEICAQCIDQAAIDELISTQNPEKTCIAKAIEAGVSKPSRFEQLIQEDDNNTPCEKNDGSVDHKNIHNFIVIEKGQPLLRRIAAKIGTSGLDVLGAEIPAEAVKDLPFPKKLDGVEIDPSDENLLIAAVNGHPVYTKDGVMVDPVLHLTCVNMQSGNINFSGSVLIKGDVESGFSVKADKDIIVKGTVLKATITSGGSILVSEGIIGADTDAKNEPISEHSSASDYTCQLTAAKDIHAKFITLSNVQCGGDIVAKEYLLNSRVQAKGVVRLGQTGGKGCIMGGHTHGDKGIVAKVLGSEAYVLTPVSAGRCPQAKAQLDMIETEFTQLQQQHQDALEEISAFKDAGDAEPEKLAIQKTIDDLQQKLHSLTHKSKVIQGAITIMSEAKIAATQTLYPNVKISINGGEIVSKNKRGHTVLAKVGKAISLVKH